MGSVDFASLQQVEGFSRLASSSGHHVFTKDERPLEPDYRGPSDAAWTREWWLPADGRESDVAWLTAPVPEAVDTTFTFIGESANLPENLFPPNQARLVVSGETALTFDLGQRSSCLWQEGEFALAFEPRQVHSTVDGYHRQFATGGCSGLYRLAVPERLLASGVAVELRVMLEPPRSDAINWFAVRQRTDALEVNPQTNAEQIAQLQSEVIHLKRVVGGLARRSYSDLFTERLPTEDVIVYENGRAHVHDSDLLQLHNGDLLVLIREASEHISLDGKMTMVRSRDGGKTWGERQVILDHQQTDDREGNIAQLGDGTLLASCWINPYYNRDGRYGARTEPTYSGHPGGIYVGRSTDNGAAWSWPEEPVDPAPFVLLATSERIIELDSGRLLMAVYFLREDMAHYGCAAYCSDDGGQNWRLLSIMAEVPGVALGEPALITTLSGRLIGLIRNDTGPLYYQVISEDGGQTWTSPAPSPIPGHRNPASLVTLPDGTVLCVYGSREDPSGIYVVASYDEGNTWDMANRRVIRDDFPNRDIGYPSTVAMPDGRILTVYYFNMFGRFFIVGSFFRWQKP